jgi:PhnB protein
MPKTTKRSTKSTKARKGARKPAPKTAKKAAKPDPYSAVAALTRTVTPYLAVNDALGAIAFYKKVMGAKTVGEVNMIPGNKVMHATLKVGDSIFFLSDIMPGSDLVDATRAGASVNLNLFTREADRIWDRFVANGAKVTMPLADQFWGDRYGKVIDPFGHSWAISRKSKLSPKELEALRTQAMAQMGSQ